jgi:hypothetical protein
MRIGDDDRAVLAVLEAALAPVPVDPDPREIDAVRALVTRGDTVVPLPTPRPARHPLRHVATVAAAVVVLVVAAGLLALSTGAPLPDRLRAPARALGLPVDDTAVARTRAAMTELRDALAGLDDTRVASARDALRARLARLSAADRATVATDARSLLERADARLRAPEIGDAAGEMRPPTHSDSTEPVPSTTAPSEAVTGEPGGDVTATTAPAAVAPADDPPAPTVTTTPDDDSGEPVDD